MWWLTKICLISVVSAKNPLNPCKSPSSVNGLDFVSWVEKSQQVPLELIFENAPWLDHRYVYVDCYSRGLTVIPQNLAANVEALDLSYNAIRQIKMKDFRQYPKLNLLNLLGTCNKGLSNYQADFYIEPGALQNLIHLKWLILSYNYLREFPKQLPPSIIGLEITQTELGEISCQFDHLINLTILFSEANCISLAPTQECLRNFTITGPLPSSLKLVDLQYNNWNKIPRNILPRGLVVLTMYGNPVTRLGKDDFVNATGIKILNLAGLSGTASKIVMIEEGVFDPLTHLQSLNLSGNFIFFFPNGTFRNNGKLKILDLSFNCLKKTIFEPTYLSNLVNIRHLDFSFNNNPTCGSPEAIDVLQMGQIFSKFSSMETLKLGSVDKPMASGDWSIQFNRIDKTSFASLSNLTHLSTIDFSYCNVRHISSDAWSGLRHLKSVRAAHNLLTLGNNTSFEKQVFRKKFLNIPSQFQFNLKGNLFQEPILPKTNPKCDNSGLLDYSNNQINTISDRQYLMLSTATVLDLSHNQLQNLQKDDLKNLKHLCSIDISHNSFVAIDQQTFNSLSNLRQMLIVGNDIHLWNYSFLCGLNTLSTVQLTWQQSGQNTEAALILWQKNENCFAESVYGLTLSNNLMTLAIVASKPKFLNFFPGIRQLVLNNCGLSLDLPQNWFNGLNHLEILELNSNGMPNFPSSALQFIPTLRLLELDHNDIVELKGNISFLVRLTTFSISHNKIKYIRPGFFSRLQLKTLDLSYNFIQRLDPSISDENMLESLQYLDIRWNELDCSCEVWDRFYRWYISNECDNIYLPGFLPECTVEVDEYFGGCVACQSPLNLRGRPVSRYGFNRSCNLERHLAYTLAFTTLFMLFILCGVVGYSKWFRRLLFRKVNEYFRVQSLKQDDISSTYQTRKNEKAFVFFDHNNDELGDWVDYKLVPGMINGNPSIELLLAGRDIDAGAFSTENLLRLVSKSRKTIVLFSGNFCDTLICRFLLTALQELQHSAGRDQLILVEWHGEVAARVPELIQRTFNRKIYDFLRFDSSNDDEVMFFETLKTAFAKRTKLDD
ncbi:toll-like receptor 8 [Clavelina lepadiformis]|uniref:toll-like receptor 8 n=1 Tax=Clavelina lepadiformis TaxID=159417 RepID=UPI004042663E